MHPTLSLLLGYSMVGLSLADNPNISNRPNIILILADDLGNGDLGYNGCKDIKTPNIDKLASTGIIFNDHHTTASVCAPSRAGLMSGVYQQRFGFECNAPHAPMHALDEDLAKYSEIKNKGRRIYAAMVDNMDQNIGKLMRHLDTNKLTNNTMIIFASDNGGATVNSSDNGIYRGMKGSEWEGGHRVPCFINWPAGGFTGGGTTHSLTSTLDFMATSVDIGGKKELIKKLKLDGKSLTLIAKNLNEKTHEKLFSRRAAASSIRDKQWKLIRVFEEDKSFRYLLFDLSKDIGETNDLAQQNPERVKELSGMIKKWEGGLMAPIWEEGALWENYQRLKHNTNVIGRAAERKLP